MAASTQSVDELVDLFEKKLDITNNEFSFLADKTTIEFVSSSKIMFINRGLPGSGKSTLSNKIKNIYEKTVICSGDDYFTSSSGEYKFDASKLSEAHMSAQSKATNACKDSLSPIVIDNTNVKYWEVKKYLTIAKEYNYIVLLIEPNTPHKFDADKLFELNKHNVPKETIKKKLLEYETIYPYYFGWFFDTNKSNEVISLTKKILEKCFTNCVEFKNDLESTTNKSNEFFDYLTKLHCTAKFLGRKTEINKDPYLNNPVVNQNIGKAYQLEITGISITNRTISANLKLSDMAKSLWDNDLDRDKIEKILDNKYFNELKDKKKLIEKLEFADRAHITIALASNQSAVQAGIDIIDIKLRRKFNEMMNKSVDIREFGNCEISYLKDCYCYVNFKKSIFLNSIFGGEY